MTNETEMLQAMLNDPAFAELAKQKAAELGIDLSKPSSINDTLSKEYGISTPAKRFGGYVYYCEDCALQIKCIFDALHAAPDNQQFWVSEGIQPTTMYSQWYHGKKYLLEHMDPNGFYKNLASKIRCKKYVNKTQKGLVFSYMVRSVLRKIKLQAVERAPMWRMKIEKFIEESVPGDKLKLEKLMLTEADMNEVNAILEDDTKFMYNLSPKHVTIIRVQDDHRESTKDECFPIGKPE